MEAGDKPIVFFDGHCGLCNRSVDLIVRRDRGRHYRFSPLQGKTAVDIFSGTTEQDLMRSFWLKDEKGLHNKSTAALRVSRHLGGLYPLLVAFLIVPRPIRDWVYDLVAKNRYKMFGRTESCRVPSPEERAFFLP